MIKSVVKFVHSLRLFFLAVILVSFLFYLGLNPVDVGVFIGAKLGRAVGMSVGVPDNPFNRIAWQLEEKEIKLAAKEKELNARAAELAGGGDQPNATTWLLGGGIIMLFVLVTANYYLDYRRRRQGAGPNKTV